MFTDKVGKLLVLRHSLLNGFKNVSYAFCYIIYKRHYTIHIILKTDTPKSFGDYEITLTELKDLQPEILDGV